MKDQAQIVIVGGGIVGVRDRVSPGKDGKQRYHLVGKG